MARLDKVVLSAQQAAVIGALKAGPCTSLQLQRSCFIMAVGTRICELRKIGFPIDTQLVPLRSRKRNPAHVALYTLVRKRRGARRPRAAANRRQAG